jgi:hypothetical protein
MNPASWEKRREARRAADGAVDVWFENPAPARIEGRLVDLSEGGFRMTHACRSLQAGQLVQFSHFEAAGRARVVWNRIVEQRVETGFVVLALGPLRKS